MHSILLLFPIRDHFVYVSSQSGWCYNECNVVSHWLVHSQNGPSRGTKSPEFYHSQPRNFIPLQWRHNERDSVSNHQLTIVYSTVYSRHRSKKTSKLRVTGLCAGNSLGTREFPAQRASYAENVSIWWCHHAGPQWHSCWVVLPLICSRLCNMDTPRKLN